MPIISRQLQTRIFSALGLLGLIFLCSFFLGHRGLLYLGIGLVSIASYEYAFMHFKVDNFKRRLSICYFLSCFALLLLVIFGQMPILFFATVAVLSACVSLWLLRLETTNERQLKTLSELFIGLVYLGVFPALALRLLLYNETQHWFWFLVIIVAAGDISAYFFGRTFGKRPLLKSMSPNKTLEGFLGAIFSAVIVSLLFRYIYEPEAPVWVFIFAGPVISFCAQTGDLFESLIKRTAGVKDSSKIMPGHGGLLDRIDGHLFASPIVYICFYFLSFVVLP